MMTPNQLREQAAQDARDRLAEQTAMMLVALLEKSRLGDLRSINRAMDAVSDLRHFTGRDHNGSRIPRG